MAAVVLMASGAAHAANDTFFADLDKDVPPKATKLEGAKPASDPLSIDKLLDDRAPKPRPADTLSSLDPDAWVPEHALGSAKLSSETKRSPETKPSFQTQPVPDPKPASAMAPAVMPDKKAKAAETSIDLDPDDAVKVPTSVPTHDPLDAHKPTVEPAQQAKDVLSPLELAIKTALDNRAAVDLRGPQAAERRKERDAIAFFYAAHGFAPQWSANGEPIAAVEPVLTRLAHASDDALTLPVPPVTLMTKGSLADIAESDLALTEAVISYARQATGSRVDPAAISPLIGARPTLADPGEVLDMLAKAGVAAGDKLQDENPVDPRYVALRDKLVELHKANTPEAELPIPSGPTLRVGMHDPRVPLIRSRFSLDTVPDDDPSDLEYDTKVAGAVADFQRANGLKPSGNLTQRTIIALSGGEPSNLDGALSANMEMWRWMPRNLGRDRIEVNVPEFTVTVFHDGEPVAQNRVVVGKTATPTPLFSNTMKYLIVNPVWNVPDSIIKKEFLPKSGGDPSYMAAHGFDVSYDHGRLVVKQPSGAKNALGRVKFMFPNDYSVYLHDTPSKSLFASSKRAFSHGCVRVDQPFDFAASVLNDGVPEGGDILWSKKRLTSMLGDHERYVYLPEPLPIHIEYFTAIVDPDDGHLQLRDDVYDYTRKVATALGIEG